MNVWVTSVCPKTGQPDFGTITFTYTPPAPPHDAGTDAPPDAHGDAPADASLPPGTIRVTNLEDSLKFYCDQLRMKLLRKHDFPGGEFTLAFVGYGDEKENAVIELTWNWGTSKYEIGTAYGHVALGVDDIYKTCTDLKQKGVNVVREPGPMKHGTTSIAFIEDPNGYKIELIETNRSR